jgi:hypothetical protein
LQAVVGEPDGPDETVKGVIPVAQFANLMPVRIIEPKTFDGIDRAATQQTNARMERLVNRRCRCYIDGCN